MYEISAANNGTPLLNHKLGMREYRLHLEQNKKSLISNMMKGFRIFFVGFLVSFGSTPLGYNNIAGFGIRIGCAGETYAVLVRLN
jgi:hypothetical protein